MCIKVVIADDEAITRTDLRERLQMHGYQVVGEATDGFDAIEVCREVNPDLVLMDIKMPILDGLGAAQIIHDENLAGCIIMITAYSDTKYVDRSNEIGVMGYISKPFRDNSLFPTIEIAVKRSQEMNRLKKELEDEKRKLEERKVIDRAKGIIMAQNSMTEKDAYEYLRMVSMNKRKPMRVVAEMIILNDKYIND